MIDQPKTIQVEPESELARALEEAAAIVLERNGVRSRVSREADDIWADYDPERAREGLRRFAGLISRDEAEAIKADIYCAREEGTRPPVRHLVDSAYLIDAVGALPAAVQTLERLSEDGLAVSAIAVVEVYEGAYRLPDPGAMLASFRAFLAAHAVLPVAAPVAANFARTRAGLRRQGHLIPDMDLLITATALTHDLTLVTRNLRHFGRIDGPRLFEPDDPR